MYAPVKTQYRLIPFTNQANRKVSGWYTWHKGRPIQGPFKTRREADAAALDQDKRYQQS